VTALDGEIALSAAFAADISIACTRRAKAAPSALRAYDQLATSQHSLDQIVFGFL
jgi:hypothetical protein